MWIKRMARWVRYLALAPLLLLSGCSTQGFWLFDPKGPMANASLYYMTIDVAVMLGIVGITALMIMWFMWRYRKAHGKGKYDPKWSHSNVIEVIVWGIPIIAVGFLSYYSIEGTYAVNPYDPTVIKEHTVAGGDPLEVDVITTDWRWLFVYPKYHIASVNELVVPAHTPVYFRLTSTSVVNDFFIPQLVGMIDVMPGMRTKSALLANHVGDYQGFSADYSGAGFSWMQFRTKAVSAEQFRQWTQQIQTSPRQLSYAAFNAFAKPYIDVSGKPEYFSGVQDGLFDHVLGEVMNGKVWPIPMAMTENMVAYMKEQNARTPTRTPN
ncbi:MAG: COX aromatic rich motif-containing protein [Gammaproteobacteria bacterium]|nr:COX aromatic rich motif-containing protein [Gammaproteobacteria bacterium]